MKKNAAADQIREDFRRKSETYFELNYLANKNINRQFRQELIRSLLEKTNIRGMEVLDAGAGPGVLGEIVKSLGGEYFASDISFHNIASARKRIGPFPGVVADTCHLPFVSQCFDVVVSIGSLEYIENYDEALAEICRVLRPGGTLIFTIASNQSPANWINDRILYPFKKRKMQKRGQPLYRRHFSSLKQTAKLLSDYNFRILEHQYITPGLLDNQLKKIKALNKLERILVKRFDLLSRAGKEIVIVAEPVDGQK